MNTNTLLIMSCPRCNNDSLTDYDDKTWTHVAGFFWKHTNPLKPVSSIFNIGKSMINVGRTIYYDFSSISQTDQYWYCPVCEHYFIACPHCGHLNDIGKYIMVSPKRIDCEVCDGEYVYATHPSSDDDLGIDPSYRYP